MPERPLIITLSTSSSATIIFIIISIIGECVAGRLKVAEQATRFEMHNKQIIIKRACDNFGGEPLNSGLVNLFSRN